MRFRVYYNDDWEFNEVKAASAQEAVDKTRRDIAAENGCDISEIIVSSVEQIVEVANTTWTNK